MQRTKKYLRFCKQEFTELDEIVKLSDAAAEQKKAIIDEIDHMEKYLSARVKELRAQIDQL